MEHADASSVIRFPWASIWFSPQATIRHMVTSGRRSAPPLLAAAPGVLYLAAGAIDDPAVARDWHWLVLTAFALAVGPILGTVIWYLFGALAQIFGWIMGGRASQQQLRAAYAWSAMPVALAALVILAGLGTWGQELLRQMAFAATARPEPAMIAVLAASGLLTLWSVLLLMRMVGAVQAFGIVRSALSVVLALAGVVLLGLSVRIFLLQPYDITADSMQPTLLVTDRVYVNKLSYGYGRYSLPFGEPFAGRRLGAEPQRGDVIIFRDPATPTFDRIARVVGLPGEKLRMTGGVLAINGRAVLLDRQPDFLGTDTDGRRTAIPRYRETLPNGVSYQILDRIAGGALDTTPLYKVPPGHYFVLGDDRDNSADSRIMGELGFVPFDNLIGRVAFTAFSATPLSGDEGPAQAFANIRWERLFRVP